MYNKRQARTHADTFILGVSCPLICSSRRRSKRGRLESAHPTAARYHMAPGPGRIAVASLQCRAVFFSKFTAVWSAPDHLCTTHCLAKSSQAHRSAQARLQDYGSSTWLQGMEHPAGAGSSRPQSLKSIFPAITCIFPEEDVLCLTACHELALFIGPCVTTRHRLLFTSLYM